MKPVKTQRIIRATRLCLTILIAELIIRYFNINHSAWIPITITVVLFDQATVGGILNRSFLRLCATISGILIGLATLFVFKNNVTLNIVATLIATFIYAYLFMDKKNSYIGILGLVTLFMILLSNDSINTSIYRSSNIIFGIIIAIVMSLIFFPQSAKKTTSQLLIASIEKIKITFELLLSENQNNYKELETHFLNIESGLISQLTQFSRYLDEAKFEGQANKLQYYSTVLLSIRRIYRILNVIYQTNSYANLHNHKEIKLILQNLYQVYSNLYDNLTVNKKELLHIDTTTFTKPDSITDKEEYDLIFIHKILNHLIDETNHLTETLVLAHHCENNVKIRN